MDKRSGSGQAEPGLYMTNPPIFKTNACSLIGMVHLLPLPGSPGWAGSIKAVSDRAMEDARILTEEGCDGIIIENMGDLPYLRAQVDAETIAAFAAVASRVCELGCPTGIQVLAAANREALGIALASGAQFIRAEAFAYAHVADEGWIDASAGPLTRVRRNLGAPIQIWADVQKKHAAHTVTKDLSLEDLARGHVFCGADTLIVTGRETGASTSVDDIITAKRAGVPVAVGSGVTDKNAEEMAQNADALIVGTWLKKDGQWRNAVEASRVKRLRQIIDR